MKLQELRGNKTRKETAKLLNLPERTYCNYENEITEPNINTLKKIADYYQVSLDYLCDHKTQGLQLGYLTEEKKQAIYLLLELNEINFISAYSFMQGLKMQQN